MEQPNRFQKLVAEAEKHITEISAEEAERLVTSGEAILVDVREADSFREEHAGNSKHLSRGTIELDIEEEVPNPDQAIICYCGGGSRSALVTESLQKMGYRNVKSIAGGLRAWKAAGLPVTSD